MISASWFDRLVLVELALKISRECLADSRTLRQSDALTLFTNELTLNYQSPLLGGYGRGAAMRWKRDLIEGVISFV